MITALVDDSLARDDINALKECMHLLAPAPENDETSEPFGSAGGERWKGARMTNDDADLLRRVSARRTKLLRGKVMCCGITVKVAEEGALRIVIGLRIWSPLRHRRLAEPQLSFLPSLRFTGLSATFPPAEFFRGDTPSC